MPSDFDSCSLCNPKWEAFVELVDPSIQNCELTKSLHVRINQWYHSQFQRRVCRDPHNNQNEFTRYNGHLPKFHLPVYLLAHSSSAYIRLLAQSISHDILRFQIHYYSTVTVMARSFAFQCALFAIAFFLIVTPSVEGAVTCSTVASSLSPCIGYIRGKGPLMAACCGGVRRLNSAANTTWARQLTCNCLKTLASKIPGVKYNLAAGVPGKCHVNVPFPISPSTDCSR